MNDINTINNTPTKKIKSIKFGILSEEELLKYSVVEVKEVRKNNILVNTIFDRRLGATKNITCDTCKLDDKQCQGHFGYIDLGMYIVHPLFHKNYVYKLLKYFCFYCSRLLVDKDFLYNNDLYIPNNKMNIIKKSILFEEIKDCKKCLHCGKDSCRYVFNSKENKVEISLTKKKKSIMPTEDIKRIFDNIQDKDLKLLGIDPLYFHPKNIIIRYLAVIPTSCRPSMYADGLYADSDISGMLNDIVKEVQKEDTPENKESKIFFRVSIMMDNKQKIKHPNGKVKQCIKKSLNGKRALIREDLFGSRELFSARTVLGGDPLLEINQIIIPDYIAEFVTVPETVNRYNYGKLTNLINEGKVQYLYRKNVKTDKKTGVKTEEIDKINLNVATTKQEGTQLKYGDIIIRGDKKLNYYSKGDVVIKKEDVIIRDKEKIDVTLPIKREYKLQIGDIVHRNILNDDYVIFNRQPSLSKGSLMASRVLRTPHGKTIRIPLAITASMNAD